MDPDHEHLSIGVERFDDYAVVRPVGYLNAFIGDQIDKACDRLLAEGIHYIIINFRNVTMVNTIGISILIGIIERMIQHEGLVYFTELGATDREIFEVLDLSTISIIFGSDADAIEHMKRDREAVRRAGKD